ncbi:histidyl-tRNA synthetase [Marinilactibacillus piezotolerans]|uniref:Histidine--tRNA ligase n=1 Tax=Marinilactibacillus piezotolerans TaxID=258723 RepID=A0A1I3UPN0_9LACT|nr:histidine--tRNA ligase [Marinilactibacillus piezotolerans]SFJ85304.1 histidyl-tRNA synthetase [Marinilactibacillus piezotolerans]
MSYQKIKGTPDFLPEDTNKWQYIENHAKEILARYQFKEVRTPIFEQFELFSRGVGETSDIVSKEMYDFYDKGNRHIALRPEGTAGVVRSYVENKLYGPEHHKPLKYYYIAPMFRYERPQKGRMRQFHQLGVEVFGSSNPATDVETMALAMDIFKSFNIKNLKLVINSLGNIETRKIYRQALINYLEPHFDDLSKDSKERLYKNPLRVLDSKNKKDKEIVAEAPSILDYLDENSKNNFETVKEYLEALDINYEIDNNMVRGLDYYNDTIFEIMTEDPDFGSNTTVCAGGRYDGLVEEIGGPSTPGFGFGIGLERLVMLLENMEYDFPEVAALDIFIVTIGKETNKEAIKLASVLRAAGLNVEREFLNRKPAKQFKTADKLNAKYVFTLGENELNKGTINVKLLETGKETVLSLDKVSKGNIVEYLEEIENSLKD